MRYNIISLNKNPAEQIEWTSEKKDNKAGSKPGSYRKNKRLLHPLLQMFISHKIHIEIVNLVPSFISNVNWNHI